MQEWISIVHIWFPYSTRAQAASTHFIDLWFSSIPSLEVSIGDHSNNELCPRDLPLEMAGSPPLTRSLPGAATNWRWLLGQALDRHIPWKIHSLVMGHVLFSHTKPLLPQPPSVIPAPFILQHSSGNFWFGAVGGHIVPNGMHLVHNYSKSSNFNEALVFILSPLCMRKPS